MREGWADGSYSAAAERRLRDVAIKLREELPTVQSRYKAAFKRITGHSYTPELWTALFHPLKATSIRASWRRSKPHGGVKLVDEATMAEAGADLIANAPSQTGSDDLAYCELIDDIRSLILRERTDDEIIIELELKIPREEAVAVIDYFRARKDDGL
jgi:hypothetical protein